MKRYVVKRYVAPSILAADFGKLTEVIGMLNQSCADWIHCDIMDGVFVPNISFGFPILSEVSKHAQKPLDVHLMLIDPEKYITRFRDAGAQNLTIHFEVCRHLHRIVEEIKSLGMNAGIALNPHTPVFMLEDILPFIDQVLLMSVNPGYGGQKFIGHTHERVTKLRKLCNDIKPDVLIEVDGGIDLSNAASLYESGVNVLVAGTSIFGASDPVQMIADLKNAR